MTQQVRQLEPQVLWNHFEDLNAVPRPSKKEERVIAFMQAFGKKLDLETYTDPAGNVIIKKPASKGMENRKTVIIQSHLDMVHQKNNDTQFDFNSQGIESYVDGDWVKARGTTLGADNGIGVAAIMSLLSSSDIAHPPIEALFTIDEETGMTGAFNLEKGILKGEILLNLDTEDDDEFSIGCAGGIDTNTLYRYQAVAPKEGSMAYEIVVSGLKGGHSGVDIHLERGNANKILARLLESGLPHGIELAELDGGSLRNAIPREAKAIVSIQNKGFEKDFEQLKNDILSEYQHHDNGLKISMQPCTLPGQLMSAEESTKAILALRAVHNGVFRMSPSIEGLVETSSSLARIILKDGEFITQSLQRSSLESGKMEVASAVAAAFRLMGCETEHSGSYPGWAPNPESAILEAMKEKYEQLFGEAPHIAAIHAGLECGIIGERAPGLDMISFGPTIKNPHSPDEKVGISSVQKFWKLLLEVLKEIPVKN